MAGVVDGWIDGWVLSDAVRVAVPEVLSVTLRALLPLTRLVLAGRAALASDDVKATVSLVLTTFQLASTALTVTVKAVPAVCADGVPVLPATLPGEAVSPGVSSCSLAKAPMFTVMAGLVELVLLPSAVSVAVAVRLPVVPVGRLR